MKPTMKTILCLILGTGMAAEVLPVLAQSAGTGSQAGPVPAGSTPPASGGGQPFPPWQVPVIVNPYVTQGIGTGPAPSPTGVITQDGAVIMPADASGHLTPAQVEAVRRREQERAKSGILENPPPAIGIDGEGNGQIVSGASIR